MPGPCNGKNCIPILVTDYIQERRGEPGLLSFEYNMLPKLISNFYALHRPAIRNDECQVKKLTDIKPPLKITNEETTLLSVRVLKTEGIKTNS